MNIVDTLLIRASVALSQISLAINPLDILQGDYDKSLDGKGLANLQFKNADGTDVFSLLNLGGLFVMLRNDLYILAACVILVCLLKLMILKRPADTADKKMDIVHKLIIVFIAASLISFLNILYKFFATLFV